MQEKYKVLIVGSGGRDNPGNYKVDNVTIWNRALTSYEINTVKNNIINGDDDDLLVWWNMEMKQH